MKDKETLPETLEKMGSLEEFSKFLTTVDLNQFAIRCNEELPQRDTTVNHHFGPGMYIREIVAPAETFMIGFYQKTDHMNIFVKGRVLMLKDGEVIDLKAPQLFTAPPGQKCGYIVEEMVWLNIYITDETNVGKLEEMFLDKDIKIDQYMQYQLDIIACREDYKKVLAEVNMTEEEVQAEVQRTDTMMEMPRGSYQWAVYPSPIHGEGIFATGNIPRGELIGLAAREGLRTLLGRYTNHSPNPNAKFVTQGKSVFLVSIEDIQGNKGGQYGHEITIDYRCTPRHGR